MKNLLKEAADPHMALLLIELPQSGIRDEVVVGTSVRPMRSYAGDRLHHGKGNTSQSSKRRIGRGIGCSSVYCHTPPSYGVEIPSETIRRNRSQINPLPDSGTHPTPESRDPIVTRSRTGTPRLPPQRLA